MTLCEVCGAYSRRSCEMEDEIGTCPWEDAGGWDEPDPDRLREDRDDRAREGDPK